MSDRAKRIAVAVAAREPDRVAEALRAAVGLGLRGDDVSVAFASDEARAAVEHHPAAHKALATLELLGRRVADAGELAEIVAAADAAEVWT